MRSDQSVPLLEQIGAEQWNLITTAQAETVGVSRVTLKRLRDRGILQRLRQGVYALPSANYGPLQELQAAWLSTSARELAEGKAAHEQAVVVSHLSAAQVHGLGNVFPGAHEFTVNKRRQTSQQDLRFHRGDLTSRDRLVVNGLPVTSIPRTVEDLAASRLDFDHLASVVRDSLAGSDVRVTHLSERLEPAARRFGFEDGKQLVQACLEQAGLPTVASNLLGSALDFKALLPQAQALNLFSEKHTDLIAQLTAELGQIDFSTLVPQIQLIADIQKHYADILSASDFAATAQRFVEQHSETMEKISASLVGEYRRGTQAAEARQLQRDEDAAEFAHPDESSTPSRNSD